tara:strand:- start:17120 stop:18967 length:1848 start_codon:yes stop_codon:yes gene_type:complete
MQPIYHSFNSLPFINLLVSLVMIFGFYELGKVIIKNSFLKKIIQPVSSIKYQSIIISGNLIIIISYPIILFLNNFSKIYLYSISYLIFFLGIYKIFKKLRYIHNYKKLNFNFTYSLAIIYLSVFSYFLISTGPVTSADSLDYHLFVSKFIAENGFYPNSLNHFHSKLSGAGEILISIGLIVGGEQFGSILQFFGIVSILGLLKKKNEFIYFFIILGSPVLLFFVSSIKPQLFQIASTSLVFAITFFTNLKIEKDTLLKYFFCFLLLTICSQTKFSFTLSYFIIGSYIIYESFTKKLLIKTLLIFIFTYLVIMLPPTIWKVYNYDTSLFKLVINPFPIDQPGLDNFYSYLINAGRGGDIILGIIFPDNIQTLTNSLGFGVFSYFILFSKTKSNLFPIILISLFIVIGYLKGQPASRFFLEPFVWTLITLSKNNMEVKIPKVFKVLLFIQFIVLLPAIMYGAISLSQANISNTFREKVLIKNANGYSLFKWANHELDKIQYEGQIISMHRSISLANNPTISSDVFWLTYLNEEKYINYLNEIKKLKPLYLLSYGTDNSVKDHIYFFKKCQFTLFKKGENVGSNASRKPFGRGSNYNGYLFKIDVNNFPDCIDYKNIN